MAVDFDFSQFSHKLNGGKGGGNNFLFKLVTTFGFGSMEKMLIFKKKTTSFQPPISDDAISTHTISHTTFASLCVCAIDNINTREKTIISQC